MVRYLIKCYKSPLPEENDKEFSFIVEVEKEEEAEFIRYSLCNNNQWFGSIKKIYWTRWFIIGGIKNVFDLLHKG